MGIELPKRIENSHKNSYGRVLNIAGSTFYTGAAYLSTISALKIGCGYVALSSFPEVLNCISRLSPDIVFIPISNLEEIIDNFSVISIGCGLSQTANATNLFNNIIRLLVNTDKKLVIDADGLNILAEKEHNFKLPENLIMTPHPKEASRLLNVSVDKILENPIESAKKLAEKYKCVTVLKLSETIVCNKNYEYFINKTGNSALSKAGSGDVLCGMISGLVAQGLSLFEASKTGVYLHGLTGELASKELTEYSVLASDLIRFIPKAIKELF